MLSAKYNIPMNRTQMAKALGRLGGRARARRISAGQRKKISSLGGKARAESLQAARRIVANFRYVNTIRKLRGESDKVVRLKTFGGRLPGIYV